MNELTWTPDFNEESCRFYGGEGDEHLTHESLDSYIEAWLCDHCDGIDSILNETVEVWGYERDIPLPSECAFLDDLIEHIDEERGDPDGHHKPIKTDAMNELRQLEEQFIGELLKRYKLWGCVATVRITVPFRAWFESRPNGYKKQLRADYGQ